MAKITTNMKSMSVTSAINTALIKGEKNIVSIGGDHNVNNAFICVNTTGATIDGNGCRIFGSGNVLEIKNAEDIKISNFTFSSESEKDFTVNIAKSKNILFENCVFSAKTGCLVLSDTQSITLRNCDFSLDIGNGICILNGCVINIENCNFTLTNGEGITVVDNKDGMVTVHNCSFKRSFLAIKSSGRNVLKITNNYFLTYSSAIEIFPSFAGDQTDGLHKADILYNLFDDCCKDAGEATIVIKGENKNYTHREITIRENIFSQKERPVINAKGVNYLIFKENSVRTNGESTVENSIINGIKA